MYNLLRAHQKFNFGESLSCCQTSWGFSLPQTRQLWLFTLPLMWKVASSEKGNCSRNSWSSVMFCLICWQKSTVTLYCLLTTTLERPESRKNVRAVSFLQSRALLLAEWPVKQMHSAPIFVGSFRMLPGLQSQFPSWLRPLGSYFFFNSRTQLL
jgi:hypothetical protein